MVELSRRQFLAHNFVYFFVIASLIVLASLLYLVIAHTRFATSSANIVTELHPHEWTPFKKEVVWRFNSIIGELIGACRCACVILLTFVSISKVLVVIAVITSHFLLLLVSHCDVFSVCRFTTGKFERSNCTMGVHITHNGDFDEMEAYQQVW